MPYTRIPDSVVDAYDLVSFSNEGSYTFSKIVDFGNTRTTVPTCNSTYKTGSNIKIYVPDALYDTWIAASEWSNIASQIHRHSELEAPYATSRAEDAWS